MILKKCGGLGKVWGRCLVLNRTFLGRKLQRGFRSQWGNIDNQSFLNLVGFLNYLESFVKNKYIYRMRILGGGVQGVVVLESFLQRWQRKNSFCLVVLINVLVLFIFCLNILGQFWRWEGEGYFFSDFYYIQLSLGIVRYR